LGEFIGGVHHQYTASLQPTEKAFNRGDPPREAFRAARHTALILKPIGKVFEVFLGNFANGFIWW
jgi:hypothetical protein